MSLLKRPSGPATATVKGSEATSHPLDWARLQDELHSENTVTRRLVVRELGSHAQATDLLIAHFYQEQDETVKAAILTALARHGNETAVTFLTELLTSQDASIRNLAIECLQQLPEQMGNLMDALLSNTDPDIRIFAINILESLRHPQVEDWLIGVLEHEAHINVCGAAVDLLSEVGTSQATNAIHTLKRRFPSDPYITYASDLALQRLLGEPS